MLRHSSLSPSVALLFAGLALGACGGSPTTTTTPPDVPATPVQPTTRTTKAPELGAGDYSPSSVDLVVIATADNGLKTPRDLAWNPQRPDELWVVSHGDDSMTIITDASKDARVAERRKDKGASHFMPKPAALAFGKPDTSFGSGGTFGTCGESRNTYDDKAKPNDFMGPVLWSSDLTVFAKKDPEGLGSHLDMLHNTPLCMGIAHEAENRYWVFGGLKNSLDRYDFKRDHNVGQDDHSDGESYQYATGQVKYAEGIPSHLVFHAATSTLYVADTGNARVAKLDTKSGKAGKRVSPKEPMGTSIMMDDAVLVDVVSAESGKLKAPSGLELRNELLFVSDNETGRITAFALDGSVVNYLDTGLPKGALSGMAFGPDGRLYLVDMAGDRVLRIDPKK